MIGWRNQPNPPPEILWVAEPLAAQGITPHILTLDHWKSDVAMESEQIVFTEVKENDQEDSEIKFPQMILGKEMDLGYSYPSTLRVRVDTIGPHIGKS